MFYSSELIIQLLTLKHSRFVYDVRVHICRTFSEDMLKRLWVMYENALISFKRENRKTYSA